MKKDSHSPSLTGMVTEKAPLLLNCVLMTSQMVAPRFDFMSQTETIDGGFPKDQRMDKMK